MAKIIFREYDIRAIFEKELNETNVKKKGYYFARDVKQKVANAKYIAVGYDAKIHLLKFKQRLIFSINHTGLEVLTIGLVTKPVNYFSKFINFDNKVS